MAHPNFMTFSKRDFFEHTFEYNIFKDSSDHGTMLSTQGLKKNRSVLDKNVIEHKLQPI